MYYQLMWPGVLLYILLSTKSWLYIEVHQVGHCESMRHRFWSNIKVNTHVQYSLLCFTMSLVHSILELTDLCNWCQTFSQFFLVCTWYEESDFCDGTYGSIIWICGGTCSCTMLGNDRICHSMWFNLG